MGREEFRRRHDASSESRLQFAAPTLVDEPIRIIGDEYVSPLTDVGTEDHRVPQLSTLPGRQIVPCARLWKPAVTDDSQQRFEAVRIVIAAPDGRAPGTLAPD
jgi:hypothetical protein